MNTQPYPMMTEDFVQPRISPYDPTIQEAIELGSRFDVVAQRLAAAIPAKRETNIKLQQAQRELETAQAMLIMQEEMAGADGAFAGIAKTSKTYGYAVEALLNGPKGRRVTTFELKALATAASAHEVACTEYEQAETLYNALKYMIGLKAAILTASRG